MKATRSSCIFTAQPSTSTSAGQYACELVCSNSRITEQPAFNVKKTLEKRSTTPRRRVSKDNQMINLHCRSVVFFPHGSLFISISLFLNLSFKSNAQLLLQYLFQESPDEWISPTATAQRTWWRILWDARFTPYRDSICIRRHTATVAAVPSAVDGSSSFLR